MNTIEVEDGRYRAFTGHLLASADKLLRSLTEEVCSTSHQSRKQLDDKPEFWRPPT